MAEELEKTCENCEYESEDMEGTHCRHCIHNAEEHFAPKINHEKEIRAKAIDEFAVELKNFMRNNVEDAEYFGDCCCEIYESEIDEIAEQLKGGGNDVETN